MVKKPVDKKFELVPMGQWGIFGDGVHAGACGIHAREGIHASMSGKPLMIAGPCSAETEAQVMETANLLKEAGTGVFRAGLWKPRTHPNTFEGVGSKGLAWLGRVKDELGMKVCTEVATERHVAECLDAGIDMLWLGARTTANPFLVQEIAEALRGADIPVLVKNPVSPDLDLWVGAIERLYQCGVRKLGVIHRGFHSLTEQKYRNAPEWQIAITFRTLYPDVPFFCDPSHISGQKKYIREISQRALDLGLDGLMIEVHCNPSCALSDASQQLTPAEFGELASALSVRRADSDKPEYKENIHQLREQIDVIDENILSLLGERMKVSRQIGDYKKRNNIAIIQTARWETVLSKVIEKGAESGLSKEFVTEIFNIIHEASVKEQDM